VNRLIGNIVLIESSQHMSMVDIDVEGDIFSSIVLETPDRASYLKIGSSIVLLFKETEVSLAKNLSGLISLRNRFKARIKGIEKAEILSKIIFDYKGKELISIISTRSTQKLSLTEGDEIEWLVKTNEVSLCSL